MEQDNSKSSEDRYPPIADYGFISDCHSMALISTFGSIDWCAMPRIDANSVFGRILDWDKGGYCSIHPEDEIYESSRRYHDDALILETVFKTEQGEAKLYDCFAMRAGGRENPLNQIIRIVEGVHGEVPMSVAFAPRFDYGLLKPWFRRCNKGANITATGGHQGLLLTGDIELEISDGAACFGSFTIKEGQRKYLSIIYRRPHKLDGGTIEAPDTGEIERRFKQTIDWWHGWSSQVDYEGPYKEHVKLSALVLKGLTNASTGAIAAAARTDRRLTQLGLPVFVGARFGLYRSFAGNSRI